MKSKKKQEEKKDEVNKNMANNIKNIIKFENIPQTIITEIMEKIKDEKGDIGSIDFNKIIPMPDHIYKGELDGEAYRTHGSNNSVDWTTRFWGTKWNAFNFEEQDTDNCI